MSVLSLSLSMNRELQTSEKFTAQASVDIFRGLIYR